MDVDTLAVIVIDFLMIMGVTCLMIRCMQNVKLEDVVIGYIASPSLL